MYASSEGSGESESANFAGSPRPFVARQCHKYLNPMPHVLLDYFFPILKCFFFSNITQKYFINYVPPESFGFSFRNSVYPGRFASKKSQTLSDLYFYEWN